MLVDHSQVDKIPKKKNMNGNEVDNAKLESDGAAYLNDDEEDFHGY